MNITIGRIVAAVIGTVLLLAALVIVPQLFTNVDAKEIVVIQRISGHLDVIADPGWTWQGMGKLTRYARRDQFGFSAISDQGKNVNESIQTRFNDGGHANISGTINWAMPLQPEKVVRLHKDFGSTNAIEQQLMRTVVQKVIYNVGPTMSSTESSAEKRPEIPKYIDDQLVNGTYLTKTVQVTVKDPITNQDKIVPQVTIAIDEQTGKPQRESASQLSDYGLILQPVSINDIKYDDVVEKQIKERQNATTQVQIAKANATRAEQDTITTEQQGKANAAKAKWEQEVENAKTIATAQARVTIANAGVQEAQAFKTAEILRGEGEAKRKQLVMEADGQLDKKLAAIVDINRMYAEAIAKAQPGAWAPAVQMGSGGSEGGSRASDLVDLLTAKTAKELGVDLGVKAGAAVGKK
jgi:SPFH domain / Band 7 family